MPDFDLFCYYYILAQDTIGGGTGKEEGEFFLEK